MRKESEKVRRLALLYPLFRDAIGMMWGQSPDWGTPARSSHSIFFFWLDFVGPNFTFVRKLSGLAYFYLSGLNLS